MAEVDGGDDLTEETARLARRQTPLADQVVKQLAARHVLQDQVAAIKNTMVRDKSIFNSTSVQCTVVNTTYD